MVFCRILSFSLHLFEERFKVKTTLSVMCVKSVNGMNVSKLGRIEGVREEGLKRRR